MIAKKRTIQMVESGAQKATKWIGSTTSLIVHTCIFLFFVLLIIAGVDFDKVLLFLTTIVSLEAIYLSIFIQMSVNRNSSQLEIVSEDIEEISEDIEEIQKDVDEIQEDVEGIEEDIEEIQEDVEGIEKDIDEIQEDVESLEEDIEEISDDMDEDDKNDEARDKEMLTKIEGALAVIMQEIAVLKTTNKANTVKSKSKTKTIQDLKKSSTVDKKK
jgi:uncharacterized membrane protein